MRALMLERRVVGGWVGRRSGREKRRSVAVLDGRSGTRRDGLGRETRAGNGGFVAQRWQRVVGRGVGRRILGDAVRRLDNDSKGWECIRTSSLALSRAFSK